MAIKKKKKYPQPDVLGEKLKAAGAQPPKPTIGEKITGGLEKLRERFPTHGEKQQQAIEAGVKSGEISEVEAIERRAQAEFIDPAIIASMATPSGFGLTPISPSTIQAQQQMIGVAGGGVKGTEYAAAATDIYGSQLGAMMYKTGIVVPGSVGNSAKSVALTQKLLTGLAQGLKNPVIIASAFLSIIGSYPFSGFLKEEALQQTDWGFKSASELGDVDLMQQAIDVQEGITDPNFIKRVLNIIPGVNIAAAVSEYVEGAKFKVKVNKAVLEDVKSGKSKDEIWTERRKEQTEEEKLRVDYFNEQSILREQESIQLREMYNVSKLANEKKALQETIAAWTQHQKNMLELEKQARVESAKFWLAYTAQKLALEEESAKRRFSGGGTSTLTFGLL